MRIEFKLLKEIIRDFTPTSYSYDPQGAARQVKQSDYDLTDVIPVSDPNAATMAQRIMQYQAAIQLAQGAPQIYDLPQLHRQMLEVLGIKNAEKLVPVEDDQTPKDPISENMAFIVGKPTKAFIYQDHDAHIATHMAMMQDPSVMQMIGQSPMAQQMQSSIMAHVAEHLSFSYRANVEKQLGAPLTPPNAELDEETEVQLSRLVAQASQQLSQMNQQKAQQQQQAQQAQQAQQDPRIQMQQAELQLQQQELQRKQQKDAADAQLNQQRLQLDAQRVQLEAAKAEKQAQTSAQSEAMRTVAKQQQHNQKIQADLIKNLTRKPGSK
jgi:hypothetical protein